MRRLLLLFVLSPVLLATQCDEDCVTIENLETEDTYAYIMQLSPLESTYKKGDILTFKIDLPASNQFFGTQTDLLSVTDDQTALLVTDDGLFEGNKVTFIKGSQGKYSNWFIMPYNPETDSYELELSLTLDRPGEYSVPNYGYIELGPSSCAQYKLNILFENTVRYDESLIFTVTE